MKLLSLRDRMTQKVSLDMPPKIIREASMDITKAKRGTVKFRASSLNDPHIQDVIKIVAKAANVAPAVVVDLINEKVANLNGKEKLAPLLFSTMKNNFIESTLFDLFCNVDVDVGGPKFSKVIFERLLNKLKSEMPEFFPLVSYLERKPLKNEDFVFTRVHPGHGNDLIDPKKAEQLQKEKEERLERKKNKQSTKEDRWASIDTAAATPSGTFIFNILFMQKLMDYAHIIKLQPQGLKYTNNGGKFPPEYAYIEFLILHEYMHFTHSDFYYQKIIKDPDNGGKANPKIINYVGDFRSNYLLAKSGFSPLPMGLFCDEINYDRQDSYELMYKIVKEELQKLKESKDDESKDGEGGDPGDGENGSDIEDWLDRQTDDHDPGNEEGEETNVNIDDTNPPEKGQQSIDIHTKPGQNINQVVDEVSKKIAEQVKEERKDDVKDQPPAKSKSTGQPGSGAGKITAVTPQPPRISWKEIIRQLVLNAAQETEETYQRMNTRSAGRTALQVKQTGSGSVSPGEIGVETTAKLLFILDSSGSMSPIIGSINKSVLELASKTAFRKTQFAIMRFSDGYSLFKAQVEGDIAAPVNSVKDSPSTWTHKLSQVINMTQNGGTAFTTAELGIAQEAITDKYNIIVASDSDILHGDNFRNIVTLLRNRGAFLILDSKETYEAFLRQLNTSRADNVTYMT